MVRTLPVTVLIPAYNARRFVAGAIRTVRAQTVGVEEIVVVDDESTDGTPELAAALGARVVRAPHGGPAAARNAGLPTIASAWIATLDADDVWHPRKLELEFAAVEARPEVGLVFTDFDAVAVADGSIHRLNVVSDEDSFAKIERDRITPSACVLEQASFLEELSARSIVLPSTALFRTDLARAIGGFATDIAAEDTEFFLRLVSRTVTAFVDLPLVGYMRHPSQITSNWELDPVRLALYHYVMAHPERYDRAILHGFRKRYGTILYYSAANAANKRDVRTSSALLAKAAAVSIARGEVDALARAVGKSRLLRSRLPSVAPTTSAYVACEEGEVRELAIPWRGGTHAGRSTSV